MVAPRADVRIDRLAELIDKSMYSHRTMTMRSVMIQLRGDQIERLDAQSARTSTSRSHLIRTAVDAFLDQPFDVDVAEQYRVAYPTPSYGVDAWGDLDAWHDAAARGTADLDRGAW